MVVLIIAAAAAALASIGAYIVSYSCIVCDFPVKCLSVISVVLVGTKGKKTR